MAGLFAPVAAASLATQIGYDGVYQSFLVVAALAWVCVASYARLARRRLTPAEYQPEQD